VTVASLPSKGVPEELPSNRIGILEDTLVVYIPAYRVNYSLPSFS
jgi:hypothetical protein